jgi:hypothetical protein
VVIVGQKINITAVGIFDFVYKFRWNDKQKGSIAKFSKDSIKYKERLFKRCHYYSI